MKAKSSSGQSLLEVVVAVAVIVMMLVALVSGSVRALRTVRVSRNQTNAVKYAQAGIEAVRSIRDSDPNAIINGVGDHGLSYASGAWSFSGVSETIESGGPFTRVVTIDDNGANSKLITVTVSWIEGDAANPKQSVLQTILATNP